ncbi:hypothetical protein HMI54_007446 [Coelomomyces lativittatus]|nr:hypothetical protein HMI56_002746 [Coelomomyces lativittatus]KAJ1516998.1 hypothetical protein HMI54_007446 [Coelomomyces lativittatus]KAJ1517410.1 hypothetical protein HMI55_007171 [Coelomomyces lativittatus]
MQEQTHPPWQVYRNMFLAFSVLVVLALPIHFLQAFLHVTRGFHPRRFYQFWMDHTQLCFIEIVLLIHTWMIPESYLYVTSHQLDWIQSVPRRAILISNHLTLLDWIYLWIFAYHYGHGHAIKIVLKSSLKYIPLFSTGMIIFGFIFLTRNWKQDRPSFLNALLRFRSYVNDPFWLLIFPEGTLLTQNRIDANLEFSKKSGIPATTNTLIPRSTGLHAAMETLSSTVPYCMNVTLGYSMDPGHLPAERYTPWSVYGACVPPNPVYLDFDVIPIHGIPMYPKEQFETWLYQVYEEKSQTLHQLQTHATWFPSKPMKKIPIRLKSVPWSLLVLFIVSCVFVYFACSWLRWGYRVIFF